MDSAGMNYHGQKNGLGRAEAQSKPNQNKKF
jgi:hypothetical protein